MKKAAKQTEKPPERPTLTISGCHFVGVEASAVDSQNRAAEALARALEANARAIQACAESIRPFAPSAMIRIGEDNQPLIHGGSMKPLG